MSVRNASSSIYSGYIDAQKWSLVSVNKGLHKDQRTHNSVRTRVQVIDPPPREDHKRTSAKSAQRRGETSQWEASRPSTCTCWSQATVNCLQKKIRAAVLKSVATWQDPQAGRPRGGRLTWVFAQICPFLVDVHLKSKLIQNLWNLLEINKI